MNAGLLRTKVTIEKPVNTPNQYGEDATTWEPLLSAWAHVEPLTGRELLFAGQMIKSNPNYKVNMRYIPGVKTTYRLTYKSSGEIKTINFTSVANKDNRNVELEILGTGDDL